MLVVDDDREIGELTKAVLEGAGYSVRVCESAPAALATLPLERPDLLLLDVNMPGMDGWELLRLLKADESTAKLTVVMFSVKMEVRDKVHALQEGAYDYINKPFSHDDLLGRVARIFESLEVGP